MDGIVLASDKNTFVYDPTSNHSVGENFLRSKILIDSTHGIAIAHAGNEFTERVAKRIQADDSALGVKLTRNKLEDFASAALKEEETPSPGRQGELIIVSKDDPRRIHYVSFGLLGSNLQVMAELGYSETKKRAGDTSNSAIFFSERYHSGEKDTVDQLVFLAAHVIRSARHLNSRIDGLEVIKCTSDGIKRLTDSEVARLTERSDELDNKIEHHLFAPPSPL
jgi:hypothetical protein